MSRPVLGPLGPTGPGTPKLPSIYIQQARRLQLQGPWQGQGLAAPSAPSRSEEDPWGPSMIMERGLAYQVGDRAKYPPPCQALLPLLSCLPSPTGLGSSEHTPHPRVLLGRPCHRLGKKTSGLSPPATGPSSHHA